MEQILSHCSIVFFKEHFYVTVWHVIGSLSKQPVKLCYGVKGKFIHTLTFCHIHIVFCHVITSTQTPKNTSSSCYTLSASCSFMASVFQQRKWMLFEDVILQHLIKETRFWTACECINLQFCANFTIKGQFTPK